jgi:hypothetical protein
MKVGDLARLRGSSWSSYSREGEVGIILELVADLAYDDNVSYARVLWSKDGQSDVCKTNDLRIINENR